MPSDPQPVEHGNERQRRSLHVPTVGTSKIATADRRRKNRKTDRTGNRESIRIRPEPSAEIFRKPFELTGELRYFAPSETSGGPTSGRIPEPCGIATVQKLDAADRHDRRRRFPLVFASLAFLTPYLIFLMLLVPYCKLSLGELRIAPLHVRLLLVQIAGGLGLYLALAPIDPLLAQGTFICVLAPTATSAAVVTGMLGGSVASLATYCLLSNMVVALISPVVFSFVGSQVSLPLLDSLLRIGRQMIPLLILPVRRRTGPATLLPRAYRALRQRQSISFYLWAVSHDDRHGQHDFVPDPTRLIPVRRRAAAGRRLARRMRMPIRYRTPHRTQIRPENLRRTGTGTEKHRAGDLDGANLPAADRLGRPGRLRRVAERHQQLATVEEKKERGRAANLKPSIRSFSGPGPDRKVLS